MPILDIICLINEKNFILRDEMLPPTLRSNIPRPAYQPIYPLEEINDIIGARMRLANEVKKFKLMWFGHVTRHDVFSKPFLQGSTPGSRPRGRPATSWISNIK
eukprot:scpid25334/ scgid24226/ 